jgi:hypothetical protein
LIRPVTKPTRAYQGMLPKRVSIIDMVSASNACRLSRVDAQVALSPRNDAIREFKNLIIAFLRCRPTRSVVYSSQGGTVLHHVNTT